MHGNRPVTIYISAASDLMAEREVLARMIAGLPVTLAWRVMQTPVSEADSLDLEALQSADLYFLVMGSDIRAPVGLEWRTARRSGRPVAAFLKRGAARTPAGLVFIKDVGVDWQPFKDAEDLRRRVQRVVVEHLVRYAVLYGLAPDEVAQLEALPSDSASDASSQGSETGRSAVILSRERYEPSDGVIVDNP